MKSHGILMYGFKIKIFDVLRPNSNVGLYNVMRFDKVETKSCYIIFYPEHTSYMYYSSE